MLCVWDSVYKHYQIYEHANLEVSPNPRGTDYDGGNMLNFEKMVSFERWLLNGVCNRLEVLTGVVNSEDTVDYSIVVRDKQLRERYRWNCVSERGETSLNGILTGDTDGSGYSYRVGRGGRHDFGLGPVMDIFQ